MGNKCGATQLLEQLRRVAYSHLARTTRPVLRQYCVIHQISVVLTRDEIKGHVMNCLQTTTDTEYKRHK